MDLIFSDGYKLYEKNIKENKDLCKFLIQNNNYKYKEYALYDFMSKISNDKYNIYGDDFKVSIEPKNINGEIVFKISDYDELQKWENTINISFNEEELKQFISILKMVSEKL